jgi:predicted Rossmann fold flavoprotein
MTGIVARRLNPSASVLLLDGARRPGAKILISGGGRCNVTNTIVTDRDFWGGRRSILRRVLAAFTADDAVAFFRDLGVALREEADGKLFPVSGRARDVLDALLAASGRAGVELRSGSRVAGIERRDGGFAVVTQDGPIVSRSVVVATGGQSVPKTGSDGAGFEFARGLGHTIVPTTPALVPLLLDDAVHRSLTGVAHDAELTIWIDGRVAERLSGSLLWTHFGISGPIALDASRHWLRARTEGREVRLTLNFCPGHSFERIESWWTDTIAARPKASVVAAVGSRVPSAVASAIVEQVEVDPGRQLAHLTRAERRSLTAHLVEWPLNISGSRGYNYAEATAGGVALEEIDPGTMESRVCRGLYLVGEILDVDGRIGGFNFQWAWSTGHVAGRALATSTNRSPERDSIPRHRSARDSA